MYSNKNRNFIGKRPNFSVSQNVGSSSYYYQRKNQTKSLQTRPLLTSDQTGCDNNISCDATADSGPEDQVRQSNDDNNRSLLNGPNEHSFLHNYNYNYEIGDSDDDMDTSSKLVIDDSVTSTQQTENSREITFPEQDMGVYDCSQLETEGSNEICPNRAVYSSEIMDFVTSQFSADEHIKSEGHCDNDNDNDNLIKPDHHTCNVNTPPKVYPIKISIKPKSLTPAIKDDLLKSENIVNTKDAQTDKDQSSLADNEVEDTIQEPVRSLTPCLDEKSGSESGETRDSIDDHPQVPVILSKNIINKIQVENGSEDTLEINAKDSDIHLLDNDYLLSSINHDRCDEDDQVNFKKLHRTTHVRHYRDKFCNENTMERSRTNDLFGRSAPRLKSPKRHVSENISPKRKHKRKAAENSGSESDKQLKRKKEAHKKHKKSKKHRSRSRTRSCSKKATISSNFIQPEFNSMTHNIKVIVPNDRAYPRKSKKKDKKKKHDKSTDKHKKKKKHSTPVILSPPKVSQSKKVYSAGNNIMISLTIDQRQQTESKSTTLPDIKPIFDRYTPPPLPSSKTKKKSKKSKVKSPKFSSRVLNTNIDALKTLAIYDLEQSPVKQLTPPPVPLIEISDSDDDKKKRKNKSSKVKNGEKIKKKSENPLISNNTEVVANGNLVEITNKEVAEHDPETELENRLNQALNRFQTVDNLQTLSIAPTPSSPDVYDPFEPTASPNSTISANFKNEQKADNGSDNDDFRRVVDKKQSFSSDEVTSKPRQVETTTQNTNANQECDSPYSPGSSDFEDIYDPEAVKQVELIKMSEKSTKTDSVTKSVPTLASRKEYPSSSGTGRPQSVNNVSLRLCEENLRILGQMPNSSVEKQVKDQFVKKLNRQERVIEEVKFVLKPYYAKKRITKEQYKEILRKSVPKICHNRSGDINPLKIQNLIVAYVKKYRYLSKHGFPDETLPTPQVMATTK